MAKKKKRKPTTPSRGTTATVAPPAVKPAPAEPGGPNRLARKEEARKQREALRRKMARRRFYRRAGIVAVVVLVAGGGTAYFLTRPDPAEAAGCGEVQTVPAYEGGQDSSHVGEDIQEMPALDTYPSTPPASGPHASSTQPAGIFDQPPEIGQTIHSLEHGAVIIWYRPDLSSPELTELQRFYGDITEQDHVIVAPYQYEGPAGTLPAGKQMVLVAWHKVQACNKVSLDAAKAFVGDFRTRTGSNFPNNAPEAGAGI